MIRLTRSQVQPIGLDLGADSVKMLQLEVANGALAVVAAARRPMPPETRNQPELRLPVAMDAVRQMLRDHPFRGRRAVVCLPREIVHVKNLRLPLMPPMEVASAVQYEARNIFPFDPEQTMVRHLLAGEVRQGGDTRLEVLAIAAKKHEVDSFIEQLHCCGCVIESLDFEPCALYRGVERFIRRREDESEVHVLADIGLRRTQLVIGRGREISFYKPVEIGSLHLDEAVSRKLQITMDEASVLRRRISEGGEAVASDDADSVRRAVAEAIRSTAEELAREISLCLRYYSVTFRGQRPTLLRVLGGAGNDPQLISLLGAALPIAVEPGQPLHSVNTSRMTQTDRRGYMGEWAVAFGLGLKLTKGYFGARDGKRRQPAGASTAVQSVEVIDLGQAIDPSHSAQTQARHQAQEAAHA